MGYTLINYAGVPIPQSVGSKLSGFDVGGGHSTSRPAHAGSGIVHHPLIALPGGIAFDPLALTTGARSDMDISAAVVLLAPPGVASVKGQLDTWLSLLGQNAVLYRQGDDGSQHAAYARLVIVDANRGYQMRRHLPVTLTWTVTGLPWAGAVTTVTNAPVGTGPTTYTLTNGGDVVQRNVTFTVTAVSGTVSTFSIYNGSLGQTFYYSNTIATGQSVVVNCGTLGVQNNGADDYAHFTPPTAIEGWLALQPGANPIIFSVIVSGTAQLAYSFSDAWA